GIHLGWRQEAQAALDRFEDDLNCGSWGLGVGGWGLGIRMLRFWRRLFVGICGFLLWLFGFLGANLLSLVACPLFPIPCPLGLEQLLELGLAELRHLWAQVDACDLRFG